MAQNVCDFVAVGLGGIDLKKREGQKEGETEKEKKEKRKKDRNVLEECSNVRSILATRFYIMNIWAISKQRRKGTASNKHIILTQTRIPNTCGYSFVYVILNLNNN